MDSPPHSHLWLFSPEWQHEAQSGLIKPGRGSTLATTHYIYNQALPTVDYMQMHLTPVQDVRQETHCSSGAQQDTAARSNWKAANVTTLCDFVSLKLHHWCLE